MPAKSISVVRISMTLWELSPTQTAVVVTIADTVSPAVLSRLTEMGIETEQSIHCLRKGPFNGPIVLELGGSVFALEQALAEAIFVRL